MRRIHVCHVITRMVRGGAQRVAIDLIRGVDPRRFRSSLVTGAETGDEGSLLDGLHGDGRRIVVLPNLTREIRPGADVVALLRLVGTFKDLRPDVVHCHTYKAGILGSLAARIAGVRGVLFSPHGHIFDRHASIPGVPEDGLKLRALYWVTRVAQMCADRIVAVAPIDARAQIALRLAPARKYAVIPNGIDLSASCARDGERRQSSPADGPVVATVGRLSREKGHRFLIIAMKEILETLPGARLMIAGTGAMERELRDLAASTGLGKSVDFLGYVDNIPSVLGKTDIYVQPSLYESQGLALIEAMAAGIPVAASDVGGVGDVVDDGRTGLLVPPADPASIARAVIRLASNESFARRLGEAARVHALERHDLGRMVRAYETLYESLIH